VLQIIKLFRKSPDFTGANIQFDQITTLKYFFWYSFNVEGEQTNAQNGIALVRFDKVGERTISLKTFFHQIELGLKKQVIEITIMLVTSDLFNYFEVLN
jgi:hypothetical protein